MIEYLCDSEELASEELKFLENFSRSANKLLRDDSLLVEVKLVKLLAKVTINHVFLRLDRGSKGLVVPSTNRLTFDLKVHLQVNEKVNILSCFKWQKGANAAHGRSEDNQLILRKLGLLN